MNPEFWLEKWDKNEIGFHLDAPHPWLLKIFSEVGINPNQTIFVPLCGKTHDIDFLLSQGLKVIGNELSELAVEQLFSRLGIQPIKQHWENVGQVYRSDQLTVYVGDFFQLTAAVLLEHNEPEINWVYDRAALVALPMAMRPQYSQNIQQLCGSAHMLLMTLDYPQEQMSGPPFSVPPKEVTAHYSSFYQISPLKQQDILDKEPRFKQRGLTEFNQRLFQLKPK
jgi:thiopurine S-methyltransferase